MHIYVAGTMTTPRRATTGPPTYRHTVYNTSLGQGYNVKVTMVLNKDSPRRTPSIIALCDTIAKKQRQLLSSSIKQARSWRYVRTFQLSTNVCVGKAERWIALRFEWLYVYRLRRVWIRPKYLYGIVAFEFWALFFLCVAFKITANNC